MRSVKGKVAGKSPKKPRKKPRRKPSKLALHSGKCKVCNSKECGDIEALYHSGESTHSVARHFPGLTAQNVHLHVRAFKLDKKRELATIDIVNKVINDYDRRKIKVVSDGLMLGAMNLRAKLLGELVERNELNINLKAEIQVQVRRLAARRMDNFKKRLGYKTDEDENGAPREKKKADRSGPHEPQD